jgi:hypothetical protein
LWWVFLVNLICGGLGTSGAARAVGEALHHSLAGQKLSSGFDVGMFIELVDQPDVRLFDHLGLTFFLAGFFFLFMLFVTPGIVTVYIEDRSFTTGEFLGASGNFFWPFVRLLLWSLIPFFLVHFLQHVVSALSSYVGDHAVSAKAAFYVMVVGLIPVLLLFVWVRMWFDAAQVRAVMLQERAMRRNVARTLRLALRRLGRVYWSYIGVCIIIWVVTIIVLMIWAKLPPTATPITFLLLELIMFTHIFGRLWQKACATSWYVWNPEMPIVPEPLPFPPVAPVGEEFGLGVSDVDAPLSPEVEAGPSSPSERS